MKKIAMILLAALLVLNTFACTGGSEKQAVNQPQDLEKTQPKCYLFSSANGGLQSKDSADTAVYEGELMSQWGGASFKASDAPAKASVTYGGETYTGTYRDSEYRMGNSYITHYYTGDNCYEFGINSENGKLVGINFQTESFYKKESAASELRNARERAEEVARECAANFVNLEECGEPTVSVVPLGDESGAALDLYQYFFCRKLNGIETRAYVAVRVNSRGMLVSFSLGDLDSFDKMEADSARFDSLNIEDEVRKAFQNIHPFPNGTIVEGPSIDRAFSAVTPQGETVIIAAAQATFSLQQTDENSTQDPEPIGAGYEFIIK